MKTIKTANYIKKFGRGVETHEAEGVIKDFGDNEIYVDVTFSYSPPMNSGDYLEPDFHGNWEIEKVTDVAGKLFSESMIDLYSDQINTIISDFIENTNPGGPDLDWEMDSRREQQLFDENGW